MPNWAFGYVNVTGTRDGIKSFIERFVSEDDPSTIPGKRFFARSFIQSKRQAFIDEAIGMDTCYTCWLEECLTTNCLGCKRGNYPDCKWIDLKKSYQEEDK